MQPPQPQSLDSVADRVDSLPSESIILNIINFFSGELFAIPNGL